MLKIERLRIEIFTDNDIFGFDHEFSEGINFIVSEENTYGKSSILLGIYYCLGLEEIIGSQGSKVLTPVYKEVININEEEIHVIESKIFLQISNGNETITLYRAGKSSDREDKLITIYRSSIDKINDLSTQRSDYFVQLSNSANNEKGFHFYLEKFLGLDLPKVPTADNSQRKLYLQLIFSCMLIEQKRGWSDYYSAMPYLGVKEARKRVAEYVLGLEQIENERVRSELKIEYNKIVEEWSCVVKDILYDSKKENISVNNLSPVPSVINDETVDTIRIYIDEEPPVSISKKIEYLEDEISTISNIKPNISGNYDALEIELEETNASIESLENENSAIVQELNRVNHQIESLEYNLEIIINDINNNKDAQKIRKLGSEEGLLTTEGICPLCKQNINDYVLLEDYSFEVMTIEDNLNHLEAQKKAIEYALSYEKSKKNELKNKKEKLSNSILQLRRLYQTILSDIRKVDDDISETMVYKKMEMQKRIEELKTFEMTWNIHLSKLKEISRKWAQYISKKEQISETGLSEKDELIIKNFEKYFRDCLTSFGFDSVVNKYSINISRELYIPIKDKFDMKFASSASDNIRAIWSYTLGLLQVSNQMNGHHPGLIIFDEPAQHSIVKKDLESLFDRINCLKGKNQVIVAVTMNSSDLQKSLEEFGKEHNVITLRDKAFTKLPQKGKS